jgi:Phosphoribosylamine-glycine ligase
MGLVYPLPSQNASIGGKESFENCLGKTVLVIGGGGREHAIVDALSRSPQVEKIYCAPGNAGIGQQAFNVALKDTDVEGLLNFAKDNQVDLTVVGPEASLAAGIVDAFRAAGLQIFGHTKAATAIESSKEFAKRLMEKYDIPTAGYKAFSDYDEALAYVSARPFPAVLKYDGLAAGKGVVIAQNLDEAKAALADMLLDHTFGEGRVVVEDFLTGPEFSFLCFVDGNRVYPMPLPRTTSAPSTATRARIPAAWAPTRACRSSQKKIRSSPTRRSCARPRKRWWPKAARCPASCTAA